MKPAAFALLLVLAATPAARWLQKSSACCPLAGKMMGMACCPTGGSAGCQWKSGCPEAPAAGPAASSCRAALAPSTPRLFVASTRADFATRREAGADWLSSPPVPPPRG